MKKIAKIVAIAAVLSAGPAFAEAPKWKVSESNGTVNVLRSGVSKIAISGGSLQAGDIVSTGGKSRAVLVRGQEYVVVSPNSRVKISAPKQSGGIMQFFQEIGNAVFRIDKKATPHFGVETPYLAAVVKGTTFSVTVTDTGSAVQVTEGAVQVSTLDGGATHLLSPGMIGMVANDQRFKLTITGAEARTLISPNAPVNGEVPATSDAGAESVEIASENFDAVISAPIADTPVSLSELTGGLVTGGTAERAPAQLAMNNSNLPFDLGLSNGGSNTNPGTFGIGNGQDTGENNSGSGSEAGSGEDNGEKAGLVIPPITGGSQSGQNPATGGTGGGSGSGTAAAPGSGNSGGNGNGNNGVGNGNGGPSGNNPGNGNSNPGTGSGGGGGASGGLNTGNGGGNGNGNNGVGNGNGGSNGNNANAGGGNGNGNNGVGNGNGGSNGNNANAGGGNGNGNNGVGNGNGGANGNNANAGGGNSNGNGGGSKLKEVLTVLYNGYQDFKNGNSAFGGKD